MVAITLTAAFTSFMARTPLESLFRYVKALNLPEGDFAIFGSGPLIVRGIIPPSNDLDIICRRTAWELAKTVGELEYLQDYDVTIAKLLDGRITLGTQWGIGCFDIDELIDGAEIIDGLPFVRIRHVVQYKTERASAKDVVHIQAFQNSSYGSLATKPLPTTASTD